MVTFYTVCRVENHLDRNKSIRIPKALVDTGSEYSWFPTKSLEKIGVTREKKDIQFVMANGKIIMRSVGFAILRVDKSFTIDEVVFAEPGDQTILGARTLEGLSRRKLVAADPLPAADSVNS